VVSLANLAALGAARCPIASSLHTAAIRPHAALLDGLLDEGLVLGLVIMDLTATGAVHAMFLMNPGNVLDSFTFNLVSPMLPVRMCH
jgi:hypothetical protein